MGTFYPNADIPRGLLVQQKPSQDYWVSPEAHRAIAANRVQDLTPRLTVPSEAAE